jgi:hypothetical protein
MVLLVSYALSPTFNANDSQKRLAEITEMIHTASLFHDDVIDKVSMLIPGKDITTNLVIGISSSGFSNS